MKTIYSTPRGIVFLIKEGRYGTPIYKAYRHRGKSIETTDIDTACGWIA